MAPCLFNFYIDFVVRSVISNIQSPSGLKINYVIDGNHLVTRPGGQQDSFNMLMYADDMRVLAESREDLGILIQEVENTTQNWVLTIKCTKSKNPCYC